MPGEMSRPRLYLLIGACVATALVLASLGADWAGKSIIDGRTFNALLTGMLGLWVCYSIATCTGIVLHRMDSQERIRASRVASAMKESGMADISAERDARAARAR